MSQSIIDTQTEKITTMGENELSIFWRRMLESKPLMDDLVFIRLKDEVDRRELELNMSNREDAMAVSSEIKMGDM